VIDILLQRRRLTQTLVNVGADNLKTNLILHDRIADIFNQATKFIRVLNVFETLLDPSSIYQWLEFFHNGFQFSVDSYL